MLLGAPILSVALLHFGGSMSTGPYVYLTSIWDTFLYSLYIFISAPFGIFLIDHMIGWPIITITASFFLLFTLYGLWFRYTGRQRLNTEDEASTEKIEFKPLTDFQPGTTAPRSDITTKKNRTKYIGFGFSVLAFCALMLWLFMNSTGSQWYRPEDRAPFTMPNGFVEVESGGGYYSPSRITIQPEGRALNVSHRILVEDTVYFFWRNRNRIELPIPQIDLPSGWEAYKTVTDCEWSDFISDPILTIPPECTSNDVKLSIFTHEPVNLEYSDPEEDVWAITAVYPQYKENEFVRAIQEIIVSFEPVPGTRAYRLKDR